VKGTLTEGALPALLRAVYVGRKTGILHFTRGSDVRSVRFRQGHILSAQSSVPQEHLGEVLVRNELLTAADLERAGARKRATGKRLGETLQEMGLIEREHLEDALALHVREVLLNVFSWNSGEYSLEEPQGSAFHGDPTLKLSTGEMILETVRLLQNPQVVRAALGDTERIIDLSTDPLLRFQKVTLSPTDGYVLSRVDGVMTAREIVEMIPLPQAEVEKSLYGLLCTGIVEFAPPTTRSASQPRRDAAAGVPGASAPPPPRPAPNPAVQEAEARRKDEDAKRKEIEHRRQEILEAFDGLKAKNHFEVLGIPRASSEAQVKEAYFQLAKRFHPDTHHDPAMDDLGPKLEAVFIRLGQAYEVLRNPRTRGPYEADLAARAPRFPRPGNDPGTPPTGSPAASPSSPGSAAPPSSVDREKEARRAFESMVAAEKHIEQGKFWDAIQLLEHAVQWLEGRNLTRARVALGRSYAKNPNWAKQAEAILKTAIASDPKSADAQLVLGELYAGQGLRSRAATAFRRVLELQPDRAEAANALAALGPEDPSPNEPQDDGGFLKKLFGKR
jgi:tetratricopeptide (TPR) repeat protein